MGAAAEQGPGAGYGPASGPGSSPAGGTPGVLAGGDTLTDPATRTLEPYALTADQTPVKARRFWAGRRVPAAITAAVLLGIAGLFLYDIAAVRADRRAMAWRTRLADELATRHLDNVWVIVGAAVAAVLGLWLILLALTPGERGLLPMTRRGENGVRAGLDRHAAELVLRDRAMEVPGIRWVRVKVGRRRITAHGSSHFRELDAVRTDLTTALGNAVRQLGLAKPPQLHVHVQRAEKKG
ncbi:DUF6286 domain-containing protein [Streptomyces sp. NPDC008079]|uniref:DUF6286 domain-containing protein n=1 Tax=Streptomyces sp. NPDC008079 TaxID=3364806 RepID=UPI0036E735F4